MNKASFSPCFMSMIKKENILFYSIMMAVVIMLVIRCFYGLGIEFSDEYSQTAAVKRFYYGDRLLIDDWQTATTLIGYFLYGFVKFIPEFNFSILSLRLCYVAFQLFVSCVFLLIGGKERRDVRLCALAYLCSTPYGIMNICYNTVAIGMFLILSELFFSDYSKVRALVIGVLLAIAVLANPFITIIYAVYTIIVAAGILLKRNNVKQYNSYLLVERYIYILLGILVLFIPFCIMLISKGSIDEYAINLKYILNDAEHNEYSLVEKFCKSQYQIVRIYWRAWVPELVICVLAFCFRNKKNTHAVLYVLSCLVFVYAVIRFGFVYGSVSINLMLPPFFYWGLTTIAFIVIWKKDFSLYLNYILWFIVGYAFAICNYLATNTEILSMSSMFIVLAMPVFVMNYMFVSNEVSHSEVFRSAYYCSSAVIIMAMLIQRMLFVWGDTSPLEYDERINAGIAKGIFTTTENAEKYYRIQSVLEKANFSKTDKCLIIPTNPFYYISTEGEISSPYISRFATDINEIDEYLSLHPYKCPTKILIFKGMKADNYKDVIDYFINNNYVVSVDDEMMYLLTKME